MGTTEGPRDIILPYLYNGGGMGSCSVSYCELLGGTVNGSVCENVSTAGGGIFSCASGCDKAALECMFKYIACDFSMWLGANSISQAPTSGGASNDYIDAAGTGLTGTKIQKTISINDPSVTFVNLNAQSSIDEWTDAAALKTWLDTAWNTVNTHASLTPGKLTWVRIEWEVVAKASSACGSDSAATPTTAYVKNASWPYPAPPTPPPDPPVLVGPCGGENSLGTISKMYDVYGWDGGGKHFLFITSNNPPGVAVYDRDTVTMLGGAKMTYMECATSIQGPCTHITGVAMDGTNLYVAAFSPNGMSVPRGSIGKFSNVIDNECKNPTAWSIEPNNANFDMLGCHFDMGMTGGLWLDSSNIYLAAITDGGQNLLFDDSAAILEMGTASSSCDGSSSDYRTGPTGFANGNGYVPVDSYVDGLGHVLAPVVSYDSSWPATTASVQASRVEWWNKGTSGTRAGTFNATAAGICGVTHSGTHYLFLSNITNTRLDVYKWNGTTYASAGNVPGTSFSTNLSSPRGIWVDPTPAGSTYKVWVADYDLTVPTYASVDVSTF